MEIPKQVVEHFAPIAPPGPPENPAYGAELLEMWCALDRARRMFVRTRGGTYWRVIESLKREVLDEYVRACGPILTARALLGGNNGNGNGRRHGRWNRRREARRS